MKVLSLTLTCLMASSFSASLPEHEEISQVTINEAADVAAPVINESLGFWDWLAQPVSSDDFDDDLIW